MQILKRITLTHVLLAVLIGVLLYTNHRLFLMDQDIENGVEFQQQTVDTLRAGQAKVQADDSADAEPEMQNVKLDRN